MMGTETVPETLDFNELTRLSAREDFIIYKDDDDPLSAIEAEITQTPHRQDILSTS
jgi:hypothetical protein